jgi:acetolactate decarboxylase
MLPTILLPRALCLLALVLLASGCAGTGKVTQFSTIDALLAGVYDGAFPCRQVAAAGTIGLGTFDRLDGEMVVVGGRVFQVRADGSVHRVPGSLTTPFATVARFRADRELTTSAPLTLRALEAQLDRALPNPNAIYAIRLRGEFPAMKTRSVAAQSKPYPALVDAAKSQSVFALGPARGTVVGFRFPPSCRGLNVPGYHLHFLSEDGKTGGHILDMTAGAGTRIGAQEAGRFEVVLPRGDSGFSRASLGRDRAGDLQKVER